MRSTIMFKVGNIVRSINTIFRLTPNNFIEKEFLDYFFLAGVETRYHVFFFMKNMRILGLYYRHFTIAVYLRNAARNLTDDYG